jgi:hypothetical protein
MSDLDIVVSVCKQLYKNGKTPTSALVKFKLPHPIPFPTIISGIQFWQQLDPDKKVQEDCENTNEDNSYNFIKTNDQGLLINISDNEFLKLTNAEQTLYLKKILETTIFQLTNEISVLKKKVNDLIK